MKGRFRSLAAGAAVAVTIAGFGALAGGGAAFASGGGGPTPPWESSVSPAPAGFIAFYNAEGQQVTGGSITASGLGAYAVASTAGPTGYTKATLFIKTPVNGENPGLWSGEQISSSTNYPNTAAPGQIGTTANPVETNSGGDTSISSYIASFPNTDTSNDGYAGLYDVRLEVTGAGLPADTTYWDTVISVNTTAGTWSVDYPDYTTNTTTTLSATPASPQTATGGTASPITLNATVTPAADATGTVTFWSNGTQVGSTQTVTGTGGNTASVSITPPYTGATTTTPYVAVFTPTVGSADIGSASSTLNYVVQPPLDTTTTSLAETGGGAAAGPVTFTGTVTDTTNSANNPVTSGSVSLYDNGSASPFATVALSSTGTFTDTYTYTAAGSHSVVADYSGNSTLYAPSSSAPVTFTESAPACTTCNTAATIEGTVPAGTLSISTPFTATNPLNLGTLALNSNGTYFSASRELDTSSTDYPTGPTGFSGITVVDTQAGNIPWTVTALASNLSDGGSNPGSTISGENVGLTGLLAVAVPGNALTAGDLTFTNAAAPIPPVAPTDTGSQGLGGSVPHLIVTDATQADGTIGINGLLTLNAPTSTEAGTFTGTITFTIAS
jgi:hypothetical protein